MKKHIAASDFDPKKSKGFANKKRSMTIPDLSMTVPEMLERFARGLPINGERMPIYQMDADEKGDTTFYPDVANMDFAEAEEYIDRARENYNEVKARFDKEQKLLNKRKREARQKEAIKLSEQRRQQNDKPPTTDNDKNKSLE